MSLRLTLHGIALRHARTRGALILAVLCAPFLHGCGGGGAAPAMQSAASTAVQPELAVSAAPVLAQTVQSDSMQTDAIAAQSDATAQTLFYTDFNTDTAPGWAAASGSWSLCKRGSSSYEYCASSTTENSSYAGNTGWTDYTASAYFFMNTFPKGRSGMDLVVRVRDSNHFDEFELVNETDGTQQWEFWRNDGGAWTNLSRGYVSFRAGDHDIVRVATSGPRLTASLSADHGATYKTLGSATDTTFLSGKIGLRAWGGLTGTFDDVTVVSGSSAATPKPSTPTATPSPSAGTTFPKSPLRRKITSVVNDSHDAAWKAAQNGSFRDLEFGYGTAVNTSDYTTPVYNVSSSNIPHVVHCSLYSCPGEEGVTVYLPTGAKPEGGSDGHVAIVNTSQNREDDLWLVHTLGNDRGSQINAGHAGFCLLNGDGTGCGGTSSNLPLSLGMLRATELSNGTISAGLQIGLNCASSAYIYPATGSDGSNSSCPPLGTHGYIDYTDAQIDATSNPSWAKNFWKALDRERYGFYAADTGGGAGYTIAEVESDNSYTVVGQAGPWYAFYNSLVAAHQPNIGVYNGIAHVTIPEAGLDIAGHTHFLKAGL